MIQTAARAPARWRGPCGGAGVPEWVVPISVPTPYPIGPVTCYLLTGEPLTLIDTGPATPSAWKALCEGLAHAGYAPAHIRRILLTHGHHDHFGQARRLQESGTEVLAHPFEAGNLRQARHLPTLWGELRKAGLAWRTRATVVFGLLALDATARALARFTALDDGFVLDHERGRLRTWHLPGHSPGHVGFELVGEGIVWTGDLLLEGITPNALVGPDPHDPRRPFLSLAAYNESLSRVLALRPRLLLPGHGPCIANVEESIGRVRERQRQRSEQVVGLLRREPADVARLMAVLFPGLAAVESFLAFSEVFGHLLELERLGRVHRRQVGGKDVWAPARQS